MARFRDPILFSQHFSLEGETLDKEGLIDPFLNVDTPLFIDPLLIEKSTTLGAGASRRLLNHFGNIVRLIDVSENPGDAAWKAAARELDLSERPETALGFGGSSRFGQRRSKDVRDRILSTVKEIVRLGSKDPEMISLMSVFEEGVGPDTISDLTTTAILIDLCKLTEKFAEKYNILTIEWEYYFGCKLPLSPVSRRGAKEPIVLVPKDIVRDLPLATDWSDVERAVMENQRIRERVNLYLGNVIKSTVSERKQAIKAISLRSAEDFEELLQTLKEAASNYDPNLDSLNYYAFRKFLVERKGEYASETNYQALSNEKKIERVVLESIDHFRHHIENGNLHHIENGNLWELCWLGDKPKKERAWQLIFYAISDVYCLVNNVDISPEADMGGGPVDFKFSRGATNRITVELKLSTGRVVHGYERQLEIYKSAARTNCGIFVVLYQLEWPLTHSGDSQSPRNLIHHGKRREGFHGSGDRTSYGLRRRGSAAAGEDEPGCEADAAASGVGSDL